LRHAGDAAIRRAGDCPGLDGLLQHAWRARDAGGGDRGRSGDLRLMSDLRDLYQQVILDHNRKPRNFRKIADANRTAEGYNPLCGDRITLELTVEDGVVKDAAFQGAGCAISKAAASMMTASVIGKPEREVDALFDSVHAMLTDANGATADVGKLAVFAGVR